VEGLEKGVDLEELKALVQNAKSSGDSWYYIEPRKLLLVLDEALRLRRILASQAGKNG
jgi:hypothetical protein